MSRLSRRIREREAAIGADRRNMAAAATALRASARRRVGSLGVLSASFGGGLMLGWVSGGRGPSHTATRATSSGAASSRTGSSRAASMAAHLARDILWPIGLGALRVQLSRLLIASDSQPSDSQRR